VQSKTYTSIKKHNKFIVIIAFLLVTLFFAIALTSNFSSVSASVSEVDPTESPVVRWVDFNADTKTLKSVLAFCKEYNATETPQDFSEVLSYLACKNGNKFSHKTSQANLQKLRTHINSGGTIEDIYPDNKYFNTYLEGYKAIFDGLVGEYKTDLQSEEIHYGIRGFSPIANGFWYSHHDDFGNRRSFGFNRKHLGHDLFGSVGTPIIAIEGGTITELGWNRYGGWRIGIKSHDTKRYYYYAHLKKDKPFATDLKLGDAVTAGQVIGFLGNTGYSNKENVNLKTGKPHLHLGLQLIFHPSQEDGNGEIWIDLYSLTNFLFSEKAKVKRNENKEWVSQSQKYPIKSNYETLKEMQNQIYKK